MAARSSSPPPAPCDEIEHIEEVCRNLGMQQVLIRTRDDPDVAPYVEKVAVDWIEVQSSEVITKAAENLTKFVHERLNALRKDGFPETGKNTRAGGAPPQPVRAQFSPRRKGGDRKPYLFQA